MPRIVSWAKPVFWENVSEGARPAMSATVWASARCSSTPGSTLSAIGAACKSRSPVRVAVTSACSCSRTESVSARVVWSPGMSLTIFLAGANPEATAVSSYCPSGRSGNSKRPSGSVCATRVAGPRMVIATFASRAPVASLTVPFRGTAV